MQYTGTGISITVKITISLICVNIKTESLFFNLHDVMKTVVIAKILHEALHTSWNFSSAHCLHHIMKVEI